MTGKAIGHVFTGDQAHPGQIREGERPYDLIHMACHGQFHQEQPFLSDIDIPTQASEQRRTYLLDLFNLRLNSSLVTLSACDSGLAKFTLMYFVVIKTKNYGLRRIRIYNNTQLCYCTAQNIDILSI